MYRISTLEQTILPGRFFFLNVLTYSPFTKREVKASLLLNHRCLCSSSIEKLDFERSPSMGPT